MTSIVYREMQRSIFGVYTAKSTGQYRLQSRHMRKTKDDFKIVKIPEVKTPQDIIRERVALAKKQERKISDGDDFEKV